eukprot:161717_1
MAQEASNLKSWMKKEDIYYNDLYDILSGQGVEDASEDFKTYSQKDWDELWRKGCVERAKELKDQKAKVRLESRYYLHSFPIDMRSFHHREDEEIRKTLEKGIRHQNNLGEVKKERQKGLQTIGKYRSGAKGCIASLR